ncbi:MAG: acetyl-CoA decarbonylase/synthase complex subunit gamma [Candidatus Omnitrophica bacterium]|nr:acetyl-CoA decarbonylase/synthase complex subunit gamma [Candidatus Omnitrophota bacterium]
MALSGLDIYKLLPKTNCKDCGFPTCLAFAMQIAKKAVTVDKCPHISPQVKQKLEEASLPPIKPVEITTADGSFIIGNETVLFRHEEKFRNPTAVGFILEDNLSYEQISSRIMQIEALRFERIGQQLTPNLIAIRQTKDRQEFVKTVKIISEKTKFALVLLSTDIDAVKEALGYLKGRRPIVWGIDEKNAAIFAPIIKEYQAILAVCGKDLDQLSKVTTMLQNQGVQDIVLDIGQAKPKERLWLLTQIRRLALKKSVRSLGYPTMVIVEQDDVYQQTLEAATYILKYGSIVLLKDSYPWQALALLTLRQNIYSDPQKPLQIEPKVYPIGAVNQDSPLLVTTNFSLTYYTVVGEVEASKVPSYVVSVDTEGMSVLTAWAAEKFTPEKISQSLVKFGVKDLVKHKTIIIPGYVAVMSGDLEEQSGWKVIVGPKEASGIPSFLKSWH